MLPRFWHMHFWIRPQGHFHYPRHLAPLFVYSPEKLWNLRESGAVSTPLILGQPHSLSRLLRTDFFKI
jgi:hypothetical protein